MSVMKTGNSNHDLGVMTIGGVILITSVGDVVLIGRLLAQTWARLKIPWKSSG